MPSWVRVGRLVICCIGQLIRKLGAERLLYTVCLCMLAKVVCYLRHRCTHVLIHRLILAWKRGLLRMVWVGTYTRTGRRRARILLESLLLVVSLYS